MTEVKETIVRSKRKNQTKELERCRAIYGEENAVTIDRTVKWISPFAIGKDGTWEVSSICKRYQRFSVRYSCFKNGIGKNNGEHFKYL